MRRGLRGGRCAPTIGFGPGPYRLAHMANEHTPVDEVEKAFEVYVGLIGRL